MAKTAAGRAGFDHLQQPFPPSQSFDAHAIDRRRPASARVPPSRAAFQGLGTSMMPYPPGKVPPSQAAVSEGLRAAPPARTLVGDFHDRFWMTRDAHGDAAASAATALAALSEEAGRRSAAAHLYAVRATQRAVKQVTAVVRHRLGGSIDDDNQRELAGEVETAVGAALHTELCHLLDEVSSTHHLVCMQGQVAPPMSAAAEAALAAETALAAEGAAMAIPGGSDTGFSTTTATPCGSGMATPQSTARGWKGLAAATLPSARGGGSSAAFRSRLAAVEAKHAAERAKLEERIEEMRHQITALERTINVTLKEKAAERRAAMGR